MRNNQTEYGYSDNKDPLCTISNKICLNIKLFYSMFRLFFSV